MAMIDVAVDVCVIGAGSEVSPLLDFGAIHGQVQEVIAKIVPRE